MACERERGGGEREKKKGGGDRRGKGSDESNVPQESDLESRTEKPERKMAMVDFVEKGE